MRIYRSIYLILLLYIIAAIVFWESKLQKLNGRIYAQEVITLQSRVDSAASPDYYNQRMADLQHTLSMRTTQYAAEGITFLVVILIGAAVVYTSFARRIMLSRQQSNFMLSVTHELKSPIAAMKLSLQTMQKHRLSEEQTAKMLDRCISESDRLNDLCNNMLLASQLEGRQYRTARESVDLSMLVEEAVDNYAARYPRSFHEEISSGCKVAGDRVMLQMAINNLLENAVKYAPADKDILILVEARQNNIIVSVADQGSGIPDAEKKMIFEKFYRVGNEESRKSKGTGLGLYLTNKIVQQHKGKITVKDNQPSGAIFEISLPAIQ